MGHHKMSCRVREAEHERRLQKKRERIAGLEALAASWEAAPDVDEMRRIYEVRKIVVQIRVARQELRYMAGSDDSPARL
jgi:hypothetical protein